MFSTRGETLLATRPRLEVPANPGLYLAAFIFLALAAASLSLQRPRRPRPTRPASPPSDAQPLTPIMAPAARRAVRTQILIFLWRASVHYHAWPPSDASMLPLRWADQVVPGEHEREAECAELLAYSDDDEYDSTPLQHEPKDQEVPGY